MLTNRRPIDPSIFAQTRRGLTLSQCQFYHTMNLPEVGKVSGFEGGNWDLQPHLDDLLGGIDFKGKRVLEIGPASGLLTFEMERRGASVVSIEIPPNHKYDVVPYFEMKTDWQAAVERGWVPLTNSYWFAHEKNKSSAQVVYWGACDIDQIDIGEFDISLMSNMLLHNRDPLKIMQNCARITREKCVVIDIVEHALEGSSWPLLKFQPNPNAAAGQEDWNQWWRLSSHFVKSYLAVMGFPNSETTKFAPPWNGTPIDSFRVVGVRK
jgi:O-methyltransferase